MTGDGRPAILAVEDTSFGLQAGECMALLGVNGAGKSTCFKSLTNEVKRTSGDVRVRGFDIESDFKKASKHIGYCPQHDALFGQMSVDEHLFFYARLRGLKEPIPSINRLV
jgi:ABC-type multidrug transport system ATPase subunit